MWTRNHHKIYWTEAFLRQLLHRRHLQQRSHQKCDLFNQRVEPQTLWRGGPQHPSGAMGTLNLGSRGHFEARGSRVPFLGVSWAWHPHLGNGMSDGSVPLGQLQGH